MDKSMDISMDIMLAHLLIKLTTLLCFVSFFDFSQFCYLTESLKDIAKVNLHLVTIFTSSGN